jgi:thiol-disulfide isomerase/thioredoxin
MEPVLLRAVVVLVGLGVLVLAGRWWQRRDGRVTAPATGDDRARLRAEQLDDVGLDLDGASAGALLLGSPTCAPCTTVKRILTEVASQREGFRWTYADAADHLDIAAEHRVLRVPTLFLVDGDGRILARTSGVPAQQELSDVLDRGGDLAEDAA